MFEIAITQRLKHGNIFRFFTLDLSLDYLRLLLHLNEDLLSLKTIKN